MIASNLYLWRGVAYNEGGYSVMKSAPSTSGAAFSFSNLHVAKDRLFSEIRVSFDGNWSNLMECEYLRVDYTTDAGTTVRRYGWIDSVDMLADTDAGVASIRWHVDPWTTWYSSLTYYEGLVLRRPSSSTDPPQSVARRYQQATATPLMAMTAQNMPLWWVYVSFQRDAQTLDLWFPVMMSANGNPGALYISAPGYWTDETLDARVLYDGSLSSVLGIDPDDINYIGMTPVPPVASDTISGDGESGIPLSSLYFQLYFTRHQSDDGCWLESSVNQKYPDSTISCSLSTTDTQTACICDLDGNIAGTVPWGMNVSTLYVRNIASPAGLYIQVRASEDTPAESAQGRVWNIPGIRVSLSANSWDSYVYSGARQSDIDQRELSTKNSLVSGLSGAGTTAAFGGAMGKTGAVAGGVSSIMGSFVNYAYSEAYANDAAQEISDAYAAEQADPLIMAGSGFDSPVTVPGLYAVTLSIDSYSSSNFSNEKSYNGVKVNEWKSSCASLISAGGPLQIANLSIGGNAPASAKQYIKSRLAAGVRIE